MTRFITNQKEFLSEVINNIIPYSNELYFLIGYFYFSGFQEIYQNVKDKQIRILVGLEIEQDLRNRIREFEIIQEITNPRGKIRDNYYKSLITLFNDTNIISTFNFEVASISSRLSIDDVLLPSKKPCGLNKPMPFFTIAFMIYP